MSSQTAATGAIPVDRVLEQVSDNDNQDEWEYEYSSTKTEVYYLAVDLSLPEFLDQPLRTPHYGRGGYYKHRLEDDEPKGNPTHDNGDGDDDGSGNAASLSDTSIGDEAVQTTDPELRNKGKRVDRSTTTTQGDVNRTDKKVGATISPEHIQILELHSENPIISYRGHTFEGQWAEVIGTEAILTQHDPKNPLPALRNLAGNVDLLGACASRILTTEKRLKPKATGQDSLAAIKEEWNINIPRGQDRTGERGHQTRFLENMIALKKKRGDLDEVTVYAKDGIGKNFKDYKHPSSRARRHRVPRPASQRPEVAERARATVRRTRFHSSISMQREYPANRAADTTSIPTPRQWEDLHEVEASREPDEDIAEEDIDMDDRTSADSDDDASGGEDSG